MTRSTRRVKATRWLMLLLLVVVLTSTASALAARSSEGIVFVPMGSTTVFVGGSVTRQIECDVLPGTAFAVDMQAFNGDGEAISGRFVEPTTVAFVAPPAATSATKLKRSFTLYGVVEGRFHVAYSITGADAALYKLSALDSVVVVTDDQGWQGIWYQLAFNGAVFLSGLAFFVWRGLHRVNLPIWERGGDAGLFERANYDYLQPKVFNKRYREIQADTLRGRFSRFWNLPCDGHYVCHTSGIPAALLMRFHSDAGLLCSVLTVFSIGTLLPVNIMSGNADTVLPGNSFQQTTISNVPLFSDWYWVHVAYCYIVAILLLCFLYRQHSLLATLRRRTKRIVGGRSILIHAGLPPSMTSKKLRALLAEYYEPHCIEDVSVVYDFSKIHDLLDRRREIAQELDRIRGLDAGYEHGMLSCSLLWCPGSLMLPSPTETLWSYLSCRPCRYYYRHVDCRCCRRAIALPSASDPTSDGEGERLTYSKISSEREIVDSGLARDIDALDEELDFLPEEAIDVYTNRQCSGGAFVMFDSVATRDDFVRLVREQKLSGRFLNAIHDRAYCLRYAKPRPRSPRRSFASSAFSDSPPSSSSMKSLSLHLANLVLTSAPEPDDVQWKNLKYKPLSFCSVMSFLARQLTTLALLLLFSTPTAVLVYIKLDSTSVVYQQMYAKHTWLVELIATYLPSLLLIIVNWALLTFLFHVAMLEPSISDSRRTKSFLVNGFTYLVVSSVFLPSIGVTAAYLAFSHISTHGKGYVESFLFKISGTTFFISYICQRTFLGTIIELTRMGERLAVQPWLLSRAVTVDERREANKPWPYYYGHDYAMLTSVLLVIMLGTVITPILTPFGAMFFYVKFATVKYNFLYVKPYTPGRGHIAQTAYSLVAASLVIFEVVMAFVFLQIAGRKQFAAIIVLIVITGAVYFFHIGDLSSRMKQEISNRTASDSPLLLPSPRVKTADVGKRKSKALKDKGIMPPLYSPIKTSSDTPTAASTPPPHARRTIFSPSPANLEQDLGLLERYTDPYKVALSIFKLLGVHENFHTMSSARTQLKYAFNRLRRNARIPRASLPTAPLSLEEELDKSLKQVEAV